MKSFLRWMRKLLLLLAGVLLLGGAGWGVWRWQASGSKGPQYRTERSARGKLVATIGATGTLVPEEVIDVGAQVAGQIIGFGTDLDNSSKPIDYRSRVEKSTVLARIDDRLYKADLDSATADLASAKADLAVAEADVERTKADLVSLNAKLYQTDRDWKRAQKLGPGSMIASLDYDTIQNAYLTARAAVPAGEANVLKAQKTVEKAKATVGRAEASYNRARQNVDYCTIRSPVDGVIIDRRVNVGQTVVSSLSAPSLFLIAKDLKRMQVWASVNEADVGAIHKGQQVTFTVDAFPHDVFKGTVGQIRYNATMNQNVVTYTVVVDVPNGDLKLLPYLTANLQFKVDERSDALLVPNSALRWHPKAEQVVPEARDAYVQSQRRKAADANQAAAPRQSRATVWVEDNGFVRPVRIRTGLSDGSMTEVAEVLKGELPPDTPLVVGQNQQPATPAGANNPFAPKVFGKKQ
jgi:HlyD family secretion protein